MGLYDHHYPGLLSKVKIGVDLSLTRENLQSSGGVGWGGSRFYLKFIRKTTRSKSFSIVSYFFSSKRKLSPLPVLPRISSNE